MLEIILFIVLSILLIAGFIWLRMRDQKYLKKKTREALRPEILEELENEKKEIERKKEAFEKELNKFKL